MFLISLASAITIPAGTDYTFQVNTTDTIYYDVVGNIYNTTGIEITQDVYADYSNITISFDLMYQSDSFTLIFFNKEKEIITEHHYSGGGGTNTIYKDKIVEVDNYIDRIIYKNETIYTELKEKESKKPLWWILGLILLLGAVAIIIYKRKHKNESEG